MHKKHGRFATPRILRREDRFLQLRKPSSSSKLITDVSHKRSE